MVILTRILFNLKGANICAECSAIVKAVVSEFSLSQSLYSWFNRELATIRPKVCLTSGEWQSFRGYYYNRQRVRIIY